MSTVDHHRLAELILTAGPGGTVALTGAGISVPSGIPDFRTPETGLWANTDPLKVAHIDVWRDDPEHFWAYYRQRLDLDGFDPNPAHCALAALEELGLLVGIVTQNVDGLHQKAGSKNVIEVHGTMRTSSCLTCTARFEREQLGELIGDDGVPWCPNCLDSSAALNALKPDIILFGETLPVNYYERAVPMVESAKLLICVGSSLVVQPVASLPEMVLYDKHELAIITSSATRFDDRAAVKLAGDVAEELSGVMTAVTELSAADRAG
jgi:NAD-dependent deacetylase